MLGADNLGNWNAGFLAEYATFSPGMLMADAAVREACSRAGRVRLSARGRDLRSFAGVRGNARSGG